VNQEGANHLYILSCILMISILINFHLAYQIYSTNQSLIAQEPDNIDFREPPFLIGTRTLNHNVDKLINNYTQLTDIQEELLKEKEQLIKQNTYMQRQLFAAQYYLDMNMCAGCQHIIE